MRPKIDSASSPKRNEQQFFQIIYYLKGSNICLRLFCEKVVS